MGNLREREQSRQKAFQLLGDFFSCRDRGMEIASGFSDWSQHTKREWELEYDFLFCGTDADIHMPLWASMGKGIPENLS